MMYLARREHGKIARVYQVFTEEQPNKVWEFFPHLGYERDDGEKHPSALCRTGFSVLARTPGGALAMLHSVFPEEYK